jgi:hypothetical protein
MEATLVGTVCVEVCLVGVAVGVLDGAGLGVAVVSMMF